MKANELADKLDKSRQEPFTSEYLVGQATTMLRQQQAEIEALKAKTQYWLHTLHCSCGRHWEVTTYPPKLVEAKK
jgi:hypothetical protein